MQRLVNWRSLTVTALILGLLVFIFVYFLDWQLVIAKIQTANRISLSIGLILLILGYILYALRWQFLLRGKAGFLVVFHVSNAGNLVNMVLPARPGDGMRIFLLAGKTGISMLEITSSLVLERWFEQIMRLAALGGAVIYGSGMLVSPPTIIGSILFLGFSFWGMIWMIRHREKVLQTLPRWLARFPRITEESADKGLSSLIDGLEGFSSPLRLFQALLLSGVTWMFFWGFHYFNLIALFPNLPINQLLTISLGSLALVPPSATTLPGIFQVSIMVPLGLLGINENILAAYSLVLNITEMVVVGILGFWGFSVTGTSLSSLFKQRK